jgi:hypothetical protein
MHDILCDEVAVEGSTKRAVKELDELRADFDFLAPGTIAWVREPNARIEGWTFAGLTCNIQLAAHLEAALACAVTAENLRIRIDGVVAGADLLQALRALAGRELPFMLSAVEEAATAMKFHLCLPPRLLELELAARLCAASEQVRVIQARQTLSDSPGRSGNPASAS